MAIATTKEESTYFFTTQYRPYLLTLIVNCFISCWKHIDSRISNKNHELVLQAFHYFPFTIETRDITRTLSTAHCRSFRLIKQNYNFVPSSTSISKHCASRHVRMCLPEVGRSQRLDLKLYVAFQLDTRVAVSRQLKDACTVQHETCIYMRIRRTTSVSTRYITLTQTRNGLIDLIADNNFTEN